MPFDAPFVVDIREARCGIPPTLVKYRTASAGILARRVWDAEGWSTAGLSEYFVGIVDKFKAYGSAASVYVVPTEAPDARQLLSELATLKSKGLVQ